MLGFFLVLFLLIYIVLVNIIFYCNVDDVFKLIVIGIIVLVKKGIWDL